jgi:prevent-host-death family protein
MIMVNIAEAKARLSEFIEAVARGEQVIICNRNRPLAELRAIEPARTGPRDLTPMFPGSTFMTDAFVDPMTEADLEEWYGSPATPARVAESRAAYEQRPPGTRNRKRRR